MASSLRTAGRASLAKRPSDRAEKAFRTLSSVSVSRSTPSFCSSGYVFRKVRAATAAMMRSLAISSNSSS
ncbi:hypothetical protein DSECCO2_571430 [anaerobic digester metagenome]